MLFSLHIAQDLDLCLRNYEVSFVMGSSSKGVKADNCFGIPAAISGKWRDNTSFIPVVELIHSMPAFPYTASVKCSVKNLSASNRREAISMKMKNAVSEMAKPLIFFSARFPTIRSQLSTSSPYTCTYVFQRLNAWLRRFKRFRQLRFKTRHFVYFMVAKIR